MLRRHSRRKVLGMGAAGLGALALAACGGNDDDDETPGPSTSTATATVDEEGETPGATRTARATNTPSPTSTPISEAPIASFRIPRFGVDAPVITMGLVPTGDGGTQMDTPDDPWSVAWYEFTAKPGHGNSVFSAHVDWYTGEAASFQQLFQLAKDDEIRILLQDQTELVYRVVYKERFHVDAVPVGDLIAPTLDNRATMITCGGVFSGSSYDHRDVVWSALYEVRPPAVG